MRMSSAFALLTDTSLILLGGTLKRRERLSARLADILSNLYLACALLKQFRDQGGHEGDTALLEWSCQYCLYNVQETIHEFLANFPNRIVSLVLKRLIFPFGRVCSKPSDILGSAVADRLLSPGGARDRLTDGLCLPEEGEHALRLLELAFSSTIEAEPAMDKISKAMRGGQLKANNFMDAVEEALIGQHIDHREAEAVRQAMSLNERVIAVDDFNPNDISSRETL